VPARQWWHDRHSHTPDRRATGGAVPRHRPAGAAHANAFAELWDLILTYPGTLLATAGTLALVVSHVTPEGSGLTSVYLSGRRLATELFSW
jgi:hypothetical protein